MTFRDYMIKSITARGMFKFQAINVFNEYIKSNSNISMSGKWDDNVEDYPEQMQHILWISVRQFTYRWIEKNLPKAWYKPMFQYTEAELKRIVKSRKLIAN